MGLTIHFKLAAPPGTDTARAKEIMRQLRRRAVRYAANGRVGKVFPLDDNGRVLRWGRVWRFYPFQDWPGREETVEITPLEGFGLAVLPGEGCEPLWLGLCRYPLMVFAAGR